MSRLQTARVQTARVRNTGAEAAPGSKPAAILAEDLRKAYHSRGRSVQALKGVSLSVPSGSVYGLLAPNGAGKSTLTKILTTLARPDSGRAFIEGLDVQRHPERVRRIIGFVPQKPSFDPLATGRENLVLQGRIFGLPPREIRRRVDELLQRFDLTEAADRLAGKWSGGMQRKLDIALALVHKPRVLFLDEPTTGLDPEARARMWTEIAGLKEAMGLTVLLTTHYLDEADQLADELVIIDRGQAVAAGRPDDLKRALGGDAVQIQLVDAAQGSVAHGVLAALPTVSDVRVEGPLLRAQVQAGPESLPDMLAALRARECAVAAVSIARPSLDEVYLHLTGRSFEAASHAGSNGELPGESAAGFDHNAKERRL